jgi:hypothetical protein
MAALEDALGAAEETLTEESNRQDAKVAKKRISLSEGRRGVWTPGVRMIRYEHTQRGTVLLVTFLVSVLFLLAFDRLVPAAPGGLLIGILAMCGFLFSSLTIRVTDRALRWHFGPGLIHKEVPLVEIERVEVTETTLLQGWGVHYMSRRWVYNVSGFRAVAVRLKNGKEFLLGTDEPEKLQAAIRQVLP